MMSVWSLWVVLLRHMCIPTERRKATEQNVRNHTSCPDVNLEAISMKGRHHVLDYTHLWRKKEESVEKKEPCDSPHLSNDLWCNISGRATHRMERPVDHCSQAKVTELQWFTAILMLINLRNNKLTWGKAEPAAAVASEAGLKPTLIPSGRKRKEHLNSFRIKQHLLLLF